MGPTATSGTQGQPMAIGRRLGRKNPPVRACSFGSWLPSCGVLGCFAERFTFPLLLRCAMCGPLHADTETEKQGAFWLGPRCWLKGVRQQGPVVSDGVAHLELLVGPHGPGCVQQDPCWKYCCGQHCKPTEDRQDAKEVTWCFWGPAAARASLTAMC